MEKSFSAIIAAALSVGLSTGGIWDACAQEKDPSFITLAEPSHNLGYLPLYVAQRKGFFEKEGVQVSTLMITGGSTAANAALTGQMFAFIGSADHAALAKARGKNLVAVVGVVSRGNIYLTARTGLNVTGDQAQFIKGKRFITGPYGGTPNSVSRFLLKKLGLDVKDVDFKEGGEAAILPTVAASGADIATSWEPGLTQGIKQGIWQEPFLSVPDYLGAYSYSVVMVQADTIKTQPEKVQALVNGIIQGLRFVTEHRDEALEIARQEFPGMPEADMLATFNRTLKDKLWSEDGRLSKEGWETGKSVALNAGVLKSDIAYSDIFDPGFVEKFYSKK